MNQLLKFIFINYLLAASGVLAQSEQDLRQQLEKTISSIQELKGNLKADEANYQKLTSARGTLEGQLHKLNVHIQEQEQALAELRTQQARQQQDKDVLEQRLAGHRQHLAEQIRVAYIASQNNRLKLLLSSDRPDRLVRDMALFDYLNEYQSRTLAQGQELLVEYQNQLQQLDEQQHKIESAKNRLLEDHKLIEVAAREKQDLMQALKTSMQSREEALKQQLKQEVELKKILERITSQSHAVGSQNGLSKGQLNWPLSGVLLHDFASAKKPEGSQPWQGVVIAAPRGTEFKAISSGAVVFSDWIRGFGIVAIIDHGQGFMSLYAHADSVYTKAGQSVDAGEVIGTVGDTGNAEDTVLYFEIRQNGKPVNPQLWCVRPELTYARH